MTNNSDIKALKVIGRLLAYPEPDFLHALPECKTIIREQEVFEPRLVQKLDTFIDQMAAQDILDLQETYVDLFDRSPSLSLHLFEHIHGDSRDRGKALADLADLYSDSGLDINVTETPDYLPLFLEFASMLPRNEAIQHISVIGNILIALRDRLKQRGSDYSLVLECLISAASGLSGYGMFPETKPLVAKTDASSLEELDHEWEEQFAFDNTANTQSTGCPKVQDILNRMDASLAGGSVK